MAPVIVPSVSARHENTNGSTSRRKKANTDHKLEPNIQTYRSVTINIAGQHDQINAGKGLHVLCDFNIICNRLKGLG